jgi:hypothetical protein
MHALSGCPSMEKLVTERHNGAGRLLLKAVSEGGHGANILMADVGCTERMNELAIARKAASVPAGLFPASWSADKKRAAQRKLRPDALVQTHDKKGNCTLHIVEIKYCRDTDRSNQEQRAHKQHNRLEEVLKEAGHVVQRQTILIGVFGTAYEDSITALKKLGVDPKIAKQTLQKVHVYTVKQFTKLMGSRQPMTKANAESNPRGSKRHGPRMEEQTKKKQRTQKTLGRRHASPAGLAAQPEKRRRLEQGALPPLPQGRKRQAEQQPPAGDRAKRHKQERAPGSARVRRPNR